MNKLLGFYELRDSSLPVVSWKEYNPKTTKFKGNNLWTIRTALYRGNDVNLPKRVGCTSREAEYFAKHMWNTFNNKGMVVYYPYFIAKKSGTLCVKNNSYIIEAVRGDLWNMVSLNDKDITYYKDLQGNTTDHHGDNIDFLSNTEQEELHKQVPKLRTMFRDDLLEGKEVLVEWSYAINCDSKRSEISEPYLVFYEARTI